MTNKELYELMDSIFSKAKEIAKAKGVDYTKNNIDALFNFKEGGREMDIDPKKVAYIFMKKHWAAIVSYIKTNGQSESEPISERIKDLINYLVLLQALIVEGQVVEIKEGAIYEAGKQSSSITTLSSDIKVTEKVDF